VTTLKKILRAALPLQSPYELPLIWLFLISKEYSSFSKADSNSKFFESQLRLLGFADSFESLLQKLPSFKNNRFLDIQCALVLARVTLLHFYTHKTCLTLVSDFLSKAGSLNKFNLKSLHITFTVLKGIKKLWAGEKSNRLALTPRRFLIFNSMLDLKFYNDSVFHTFDLMATFLILRSAELIKKNPPEAIFNLSKIQMHDGRYFSNLSIHEISTIISRWRKIPPPYIKIHLVLTKTKKTPQTSVDLFLFNTHIPKCNPLVDLIKIIFYRIRHDIFFTKLSPIFALYDSNNDTFVQLIYSHIVLADKVRSALIDIPSTLIKSHSRRKGGASGYIAAGVAQTITTLLGRWKIKNCLDCYASLSASVIRSAQLSFARYFYSCISGNSMSLGPDIIFSPY